jgi:ABC-type lipoprotein release transport system permease subunit
VGDALGRVDPHLSLTFRVFSDQIGASLMRERMVAALSGFFGGLALLLAAAATLAGTCLLAAWLPARRASRTRPAEVLREG